MKNYENLKKNKDLDKFLENITIIEKDLINIFERNRIKKIDTKNKKFDPNLHQSMSEIEDESEETGNILQEIQSGYMLGERLLRPALVSVAKKKTAKNEEKNQKKEDKWPCRREKNTHIKKGSIKGIENYEQSNWNRFTNNKFVCSHHGWVTS